MSVSFVAEVSSNHHQNLDRCIEFIDVASRIGCNAVKFQLFKLEELFAPEILKSRPILMERMNWELPLAFLPELAAHCEKRKIGFSLNSLKSRPLSPNSLLLPAVTKLVAAAWPDR